VIKLSDVFIKNVTATYGQPGIAWLDQLSNQLDKLATLWDFKLLQPVTNLSYNFVAEVELPSGLAILKVAPPSAKLMSEAEWLINHKNCVPVVLQTDKINNAFLMEKLSPGSSLKSLVKAGSDEEATQVIAQLILDIQTNHVSHQINYQHISEHIPALTLLRGHLDANILEQGIAIFSQLCADRSQDVILHGDLHHDNILRSDNTWKVIDPHGYVGHPCAEVGPMMFNPLGEDFPHSELLRNIIEKRLRILDEILPFELSLIRAWCFCLALRSAAWDVEGFGVPSQHSLEVAKVLFDE
jgi:streptomycin 6-kinase